MNSYYQPTKLIIGEKSLEQLSEIVGGYCEHCLLISSNDVPLQPLHQRVIQLLTAAHKKVIHFDQVKPNPTIESIDACLSLVGDQPIDFICVVGGGSCIDTAKAVNLKRALPHHSWDNLFETYHSYTQWYPTLPNLVDIIAIPTTSGTGSQVTQAAVLTTQQDKLTIFHQELFSKVAILDPEVTTTLPLRMTAATAFDAFSHGFESYLSHRKSEFSQQDSLMAMKLVIETLPQVLKDPKNTTLRQKLMVGDTLAGRALSNAGANTPHPLSEIIGGITNATHGEALASVYPAFIKNSTHLFEKEFDDIAKLFDPSATGFDLAHLIEKFLDECHIFHDLKAMIQTEAQYQAIVNHPALDHLPFGDRQYFQRILEDAKNN